MKIERFNESNNQAFCVCTVKIESWTHIVKIFNTKEDKDNWILNYINENMQEDILGAEDVTNEPEYYDLVKYEDKYLFLTVESALRFFEDADDFEVEYFEDIELEDVVKLKYNVEQLRTVKNYKI